MTLTSTETSIRKEIVVNVPPQRAFAVFTEQFDQVKPREHNLLSVPIVATVFEPRAGGTIYDQGEDGSECHWARVLAFEPPERVLFTWDISPRWELETDPDRASEVEVRFVPEGSDATRVILEHRHLDRHGAGWESARDGVAEDGGWPLYLQRYADLLG